MVDLQVRHLLAVSCSLLRAKLTPHTAMQARVPPQWVLDASTSHPRPAWPQPTPCNAKGQRHQEGVCVSPEKPLTNTGVRSFLWQSVKRKLHLAYFCFVLWDLTC